MSRCLPFPPPNYVKDGVGGDALLKQLEHMRRKERKKRRKERKERKKERKERRRRRKLERNENEAGVERIDHDDNKHENGKDKVGGDYSGKCELPLANEKQKFSPAPADGKMKFYEAAEKSPASPHANRKEKFSASPSQVTPQKMESGEGDTCSVGKGKFAANENLKASMSTFERTMLKTEAEYRELTVNWVPTPVQLTPTDLADEEWLYRENVSGSKRTKTKHVSNDTGNGIYQGIQPHAHYLPDADIYVLPYTLPF